MTFCSFVMSGVLSNAEAGRCAPRTNSAPGLGSRFSLMTPSVRSSVDYCSLALAFIATCLLSGLINFIARGRRPSAANRPQEGLNAFFGVMVKDLIAKPSPESGHDRAADNRCGRYGLKSARQRALRQASGSPAGA